MKLYSTFFSANELEVFKMFSSTINTLESQKKLFSTTLVSDYSNPTSGVLVIDLNDNSLNCSKKEFMEDLNEGKDWSKFFSSEDVYNKISNLLRSTVHFILQNNDKDEIEALCDKLEEKYGFDLINLALKVPTPVEIKNIENTDLGKELMRKAYLISKEITSSKEDKEFSESGTLESMICKKDGKWQECPKTFSYWSLKSDSAIYKLEVTYEGTDFSSAVKHLKEVLSKLGVKLVKPIHEIESYVLGASVKCDCGSKEELLKKLYSANSNILKYKVLSAKTFSVVQDGSDEGWYCLVIHGNKYTIIENPTQEKALFVLEDIENRKEEFPAVSEVLVFKSTLGTANRIGKSLAKYSKADKGNAFDYVSPNVRIRREVMNYDYDLWVINPENGEIIKDNNLNEKEYQIRVHNYKKSGLKIYNPNDPSDLAKFTADKESWKNGKLEGAPDYSSTKVHKSFSLSEEVIEGKEEPTVSQMKELLDRGTNFLNDSSIENALVKQWIKDALEVIKHEGNEEAHEQSLFSIEDTEDSHLKEYLFNYVAGYSDRDMLKFAQELKQSLKKGETPEFFKIVIEPTGVTLDEFIDDLESSISNKLFSTPSNKLFGIADVVKEIGSNAFEMLSDKAKDLAKQSFPNYSKAYEVAKK